MLKKSLLTKLTALTIISLLFLSSSLYADKHNRKCFRRNKEVKNIIILISDGCGYNHVDATSLWQYGATGTQVYERFPVKFGMSHFMAGQGYDPFYAWNFFDYVKQEATDSAAAATAMSCGLKTYNGAIGMDIDRYPLKHFMERAEELGKSTGVITSVQLSHATPAGFVAHNVSRGNYSQIANEMIYDSKTDVIMGAGHPLYSDDNIQEFTKDSDGDGIKDTYEYKYIGGETTWNDLADGSVTSTVDANGDGIVDELDNWTVIENLADFADLTTNPNPPSRLIGIAQVISTLQQSRGGNNIAAPYIEPLNPKVPTLEQMTKGALNILGKDNEGFVLMVEGGAVDWCGHANQSGRLIEEEVDFNKSVEAVVDWVKENSNWNETLVIVTGDHETGYLTGPGSGKTTEGPVWNPLVNNGAGNIPGMQWNSGDHTNSLIPFYAKGKGAELFNLYAYRFDRERRRYIDNTDIADVIFKLLK